MLGRGAEMGDMTLRLLALAMVLVLALPAAVLLLRRGGAPDEGAPAWTTRLDTLWLVVPVALLAVLVALAVIA